MPFDSTDLFAQSGYQTGDVLPLATINTPVAGNTSTTSTTFEVANAQGRSAIQFDELTADGTVQVALSVLLNPGTDETLTVRYQNTTDNETLVTVAGQAGTFTTEWSGWTTYTPTTAGSPVELKFQQKVDNGVNSSLVIQPRLYAGVQL